MISPERATRSPRQPALGAPGARPCLRQELAGKERISCSYLFYASESLRIAPYNTECFCAAMIAPLLTQPSPNALYEPYKGHYKLVYILA